MNVILLSGGSGKRLWPLSNAVRSKQFLKIFKRDDGSRESMVQRMYRMIMETNPNTSVTIAASQDQIPQIRAQLGDNIGISIEPCRRDTFPAIILAAAYIKKNGIDDDVPVVVCPVDPYVDEDYFRCIKVMAEEAGKENLLLMGIEPTYPSEKYGYIVPASDAPISRVKQFKEKPKSSVAEEYIRQGALWNGGVFAFKLSYLLRIAVEHFGTADYNELYQKYDAMQKQSFDYAVVEKESSVNVIRFKGVWEDLGTWNTFTKAMSEFVSGNAVTDGCENTHVINELGIPLITLGIKDAVVAATPDGILVADKETSAWLKNFVPSSRPMYESRVWGEYKVLDCKLHGDGNNSLVKELVISQGQHISYQQHKHRTEVWVFTEGTGELVLNNVVKKVGRGDVALIRPGMKHAIKGVDELHIIEIQIGDELTEGDIERFEWSWQKSGVMGEMV